MKDLIVQKGGTLPTGSLSSLNISDTGTTALEEFGYTASVPKLKESMGNDDCFSLVEIGTYGAKGMKFKCCFEFDS